MKMLPQISATFPNHKSLILNPNVVFQRVNYNDKLYIYGKLWFCGRLGYYSQFFSPSVCQNYTSTASSSELSKPPSRVGGVNYLCQYGIDHVTWSGLWDVSRHNVSRSRKIRCVYMVRLIFLCSAICHRNIPRVAVGHRRRKHDEQMWIYVQPRAKPSQSEPNHSQTIELRNKLVLSH